MERMTAEIIPLTGADELRPPEVIAARCLAAGRDGEIINPIAIGEAIVAAIEAERAHADVLRKRCARLTKALLAAKEKLDKAEAKWNAEWA